MLIFKKKLQESLDQLKPVQTSHFSYVQRLWKMEQRVEDKK